MNLEGWDWDGIDLVENKRHYKFIVETDNEGINTEPPFYKNETFVVSKDSLILKEQFVAKKVSAIKEIRSDMFESENDIVSLVYDLNGDHQLDSISCNLWSRWGKMTDCTITFGNDDIEIDFDVMTKRIGVLSSKTNGFHDLVLQFNDTLIWNGDNYIALSKK